jgi:phage portal protein BeeE
MERDLLFGRSSKTHGIVFDLNGLMRGDSKARAEYYRSGISNGYLSRNEVRIAEGMNPSDDENMDGFTLQINMTTIDKVGLAPTKQEPLAEPENP